MLLAICAILSLGVWWARAHDAAVRSQQHRAALDLLNQMQRERQHIVNNLIRNRRTIAWREARLAEAKSLVANARPQPVSVLSPECDNDAAEYFSVCLAEDELNLADSRERRKSLEREMSVIDEQIAAQESRIREILEASDVE